MKLFESAFNKALNEMANTAGGAGGVFTAYAGTVNAGEYGNQFPSQNDKAYAPGDARVPKILGAKFSKKKKKLKYPIQRRTFLPGN